ncbi:hypothetical protein ABPG72_007265 [Tetrahymena utriculariae]
MKNQSNGSYRSIEKTFIDESKELYYGISSNSQSQQNNANYLQFNQTGCNSSTKASTPNHSESEDAYQAYNSTNSLLLGQSFNPPKKYSIDVSSTEEFHIDVKPKRKVFCSPEEKKKFIDDYTKKLKTEMCKNWTATGTCKFGDKCSFAHGKEQLQGKIHLHPNYKTKPCKKFFIKGICSYGNRCQYIHSITQLIEKGHEDFLRQVYPSKKQFQVPERLEILRKNLNIPSRLPIFFQISSQQPSTDDSSSQDEINSEDFSSTGIRQKVNSNPSQAELLYYPRNEIKDFTTEYSNI